MCIALISLFTCNSFRDLHQLRTTYGGPDLQSFYFVPWKPTRNNFLFEYWVFTEVLLFTRDRGLWNHILQESYPKNLTVTFINSSLFKCSQDFYRAIERCFSSLRGCCYYYYLPLFENGWLSFSQFLLCLTVQLKMTKTWQQRQERSEGWRCRADPHECSKAQHSFAVRKLYEWYLHHATPHTGVCSRQCFVLRIHSCSITFG